MKRSQNFENIANTIKNQYGYNNDYNFVIILTAKNFYTKNVYQKVATIKYYEDAKKIVKELQKQFENDLKTNDFIISFVTSYAINTKNQYQFAMQK